MFARQEGVIVTGTPRSGTTWLGNVLARAKSACVVSEPCHPYFCRQHGFGWRTYRDPGAPWAEGRRYLDYVMAGPGYSKNLFIDNSIWRLASSRYLMLKCVRLNRLVPWISENMDFKAMCVIVRHPCAVIYSQMQHPLFRPLKGVSEEDRALINDLLPEASSDLEAVTSEEEIRAVIWSLDQMVPLRSRSVVASNVIFETYETLVKDSDRLVGLLDQIGGRSTPAVQRVSRQPSREAREWSADHQRARADERVSNWTQQLSREQVSRILTVVERMGITGVTSNPHLRIDDMGWNKPRDIRC